MVSVVSRPSWSGRAGRWRGVPCAFVVRMGIVGTAVLLVGAGWWSTEDRARVSLLVSIGCDVAACVAAATVARRLPVRDPARRFWWAMSAAAALVAVGYVETL